MFTGDAASEGSGRTFQAGLLRVEMEKLVSEASGNEIPRQATSPPS